MTLGMSSSFKVAVAADADTGGFWASIADMPGCFASGRNLDELFTSLEDAISLYESSRLDLRGLS